MGYDLTSVNGDVAVGRNAEIGGNTDIKGGLNVRKNMKVEGFLDAPNIKGVIKGLFASDDDLKKEFPNPRPGWAAVVLDSGSTNGFLYLAERQGWKKTGEESEPLSFIVDSINAYATKEALEAEVQRATVQENQINSAVEELADITANIERDILNETQRAEAAEQALGETIAAEVTRAKLAEKANADAVADEATRAKAAEQELGEAIGGVHDALAENDEAIKNSAMNYRTLSATHYADKVVISGDSLKGEKRTADISAATPKTAGVMSAEDKVKLGGIWNFLDRLMTRLGISDATAVADRIVAAILPPEAPTVKAQVDGYNLILEGDVAAADDNLTLGGDNIYVEEIDTQMFNLNIN